MRGLTRIKVAGLVMLLHVVFSVGIIIFRILSSSRGNFYWAFSGQIGILLSYAAFIAIFQICVGIGLWFGRSWARIIGIILGLIGASTIFASPIEGLIGLTLFLLLLKNPFAPELSIQNSSQVKSS